MRRSRNFFLLLPGFALAFALNGEAAKSAEKAKESRGSPEEAAKKDFLKNRTGKAVEKKAAPKTVAKSPAKVAESRPEKEPAPAAAEKPPPKLSLPLVKGQTSKGVIFPYNDGSGTKTMNFRIETATPLDDDHIKMSNLRIETLDEAGETEMTIDLPASVLDLKTRVITGNERVTIKRSDFEITGATMHFNTETKQGRIDGDVKMIIYDLSDELPADAGESGRKTP